MFEDVQTLAEGVGRAADATSGGRPGACLVSHAWPTVGRVAEPRAVATAAGVRPPPIGPPLARTNRSGGCAW